MPWPAHIRLLWLACAFPSVHEVAHLKAIPHATEWLCCLLAAAHCRCSTAPLPCRLQSFGAEVTSQLPAVLQFETWWHEKGQLQKQSIDFHTASKEFHIRWAKPHALSCPRPICTPLKLCAAVASMCYNKHSSCTSRMMMMTSRIVKYVTWAGHIIIMLPIKP
jgi:hypothetical protein